MSARAPRPGPPRTPLAERLLLRLLFLYPPALRDEFGDEMRGFVRQRLAEPRHRGATGALRLALALLRDAAVAAPAEWAHALQAAPARRRAGADPSTGEPMATLLHDLRYALRALRARPGFTLVAVLTLALGIGANAAIFSIVNAMLLRPLPYEEPDRLVTVWSISRGERSGLSYPDMNDLARDARGIRAIGLLTGQTVNYTGGETPDRLRGAFTTPGFFDAVGVRAGMGRLFTEAESAPGAAVPVAVLAHHAWRTRFGGDSAILGRMLRLNDVSFRVVGVLPEDYVQPFDAPDVFLPIPFVTSRGALERDERGVPALARLAPGVTLEQARGELAVVAARLAQEHPESNAEVALHAEPLQQSLTRDVRPALLTVFAVVGLVLLIACANVANLLLARAAARRREMSVRAALGAGRRRLLRQLLTESLLLALLGGMAGIVVAHFGLRLLVELLPSDFVVLREITLDGAALLFTFALAVGSGVLFGLAPALHASRSNLSEAFVARGAASAAPGRRLSARNVFVVAQLSLAIVLLVAGGLLTRSLLRMQGVSPGFDPEGVLTMEFRLPITRYDEPAEQTAFMLRAVEELRRVPSVRSAALVRAAPFSFNGGTEGYVVEGREPAPGTEPPITQINSVTPGYFATLRIPLLAGRDVAETDDGSAPPVVVVGAELARRAWPNEQPIGKRLRPAGGGPWFTVVGVVGDTKHFGMGDEVVPQAYVSYGQMPGIFATVVARVDGDPLAHATAVRGAIWAVDRDQPVWKIRTLERMIDATLGAERVTTRLVLGFAVVALLLAGIGVYGVMSFAVVQRTQEVGVRMALGAGRGQVLGLVVRQGLALTAVAVALGLAGAVVAARLLASQLHGVSTSDPLTFVAVPLVLACVALVATLLPAWRASRLDPLVALRRD